MLGMQRILRSELPARSGSGTGPVARPAPVTHPFSVVPPHARHCSLTFARCRKGPGRLLVFVVEAEQRVQGLLDFTGGVHLARFAADLQPAPVNLFGFFWIL